MPLILYINNKKKLSLSQEDETTELHGNMENLLVKFVDKQRVPFLIWVDTHVLQRFYSLLLLHCNSVVGLTETTAIYSAAQTNGIFIYRLHFCYSNSKSLAATKQNKSGN